MANAGNGESEYEKSSGEDSHGDGEMNFFQRTFSIRRLSRTFSKRSKKAGRQGHLNLHRYTDDFTSLSC